MIKRTIDVLILALLAAQTIYVFGELIMMHEPIFHGLYQDMKVAECISEDDGSALAYIQNDGYVILRSDVTVPVGNASIKGFRNICDFSKDLMVCEMNNDKGCLALWNRQGWKLTHSMDTPMGPVFDQRWEAFTEYGLDVEYNISLSNLSKIVITFSVRARSDVNILICKNKYKTNLCYWVILGGWNNTKSVIQKCPTGVPSTEKYFQNNSECTEHVYLNQKVLSLHEWRTFVLTWNSVTRNISLYNPDHLIISYEDTEDYEDSNIFHGISFSSSQNRSFIRYHNYTFLHTRNYTSILLSPTYLLKREKDISADVINTICFELPIGLCAACDAIVSMIDVTSKKRIGSIIVNGSSTAHGLPMWQFITIKNVSMASYNRIKLEVIPRYSIRSSNPLWAIANIRACHPKGCIRKMERIIYDKSRPPLVTCQKLFYQEQSTVHLVLDAKLNTELEENCNYGYIGPNCAMKCVKYLRNQSNEQQLSDCTGIIICNKNGCTCPSGFQGPNCDQPCNQGFYSHACKKRCGLCSQNKPCDRNGFCRAGCKSTANYTYVPPLCQIGIDKPDEPEVIFTNQTTIVTSASMKRKKEYIKEKFFYSFYMETLDEQFVHRQDWKQIFENTTQLVERFEYLEPDTSYKIRYMLSVGQLEIASEWKIVETNCNLPYPPRNFTYSFKSNGVVDLKWLRPWKTCGVDLCCFHITIQEISSNLISNDSRSSKYEILENSQKHNTHNYTKRLYLLPSTLYNMSIQTVTIQNKTSNMNSLKFSTPSSVGLDGELGIETQKSDSKILLRIPKVANDTLGSVIHIIIIASNICEQNAKLPKNLLTHIDEEKMKRVWQIVKRPTNELVNNVFTINGNNSANCPLKNEELYKIVIIITESELFGDRVMFMKEIPFYFGGPPPTYFEVWFICVILILSGLSAVFYYYRK